jgi:hypothetical protein
VLRPLDRHRCRVGIGVGRVDRLDDDRRFGLNLCGDLDVVALGRGRLLAWGFDRLDRRGEWRGEFDWLHGLDRFDGFDRFDGLDGLDWFDWFDGFGGLDRLTRIDDFAGFAKIIERLRHAAHQGLEIHRLGPCTLGLDGVRTGEAHLIQSAAPITVRRLGPRTSAHDLERCQGRVLATATPPPHDRANQQRQADDGEARRRQIDESLVGRVGEVATDDAFYGATNGLHSHRVILAC